LDADNYSDGVVDAIQERLYRLEPDTYHTHAKGTAEFRQRLGVADAYHAIGDAHGPFLKKRILRSAKTKLGPDAVEGLRKFIMKSTAEEKDKEQALHFVEILDFYNHI